MSKPLVVTVPHELGRQEVKNRLQNGMGQLRSQLAPFASSIEESWTGDRLDFRLVTLGQTITGAIDVLDDSVRIEVHLPWILSLIAEKLKGRIRQQGIAMLEKKPPPTS